MIWTYLSLSCRAAKIVVLGDSRSSSAHLLLLLRAGHRVTLRRPAATTTTTPSTSRIFLVLLVGLDLIPRIALLLRSITIIGALFSDDRHVLGIHGASCPPSIALAALACFMQLVHESALVVLTPDYTLLSSEHSRAEHIGSWSGVLR